MSKTWWGHYIIVDKGEEYIRFKDYLELSNRIDKAINNLENSIKSINNKLSDKEIRVENGRIVNPINDYRIVRLKGIRTKCKEILKILKGGNSEN